MRVMITGGCGFVGSHLVDHHLEAGDGVVVVDDLSTGRLDNLDLTRPSLTVVNASAVRPLASFAVDRIYHLGSPASPRAYQARPLETIAANTVGTTNMLEAAHKSGARLLFASTSEVYGDPLVHPQPEEYRGNVDPYGPRSAYDESKRCGEAICRAYEQERGVDVRVARIFNTFGPRMAPDDGRVVPSMIVSALRGEPLVIEGDGHQTRSFMYVDDLVRGLVALMESDVRGPVNLGNPVETTILELAIAIRDLTGSPRSASPGPRPALEYVDAAPDDPRRRRPDVTRARRELDWYPKTELDDGLFHTIEYFRTLFTT